jgi:hypothetical protein
VRKRDNAGKEVKRIQQRVLGVRFMGGSFTVITVEDSTAITSWREYTEAAAACQ